MTVYVTQETRCDLSAAEPYGELVTLQPKSASGIRDPDILKRRLFDNMPRYTDEDYILCVGNPSLIGLACMRAAELNEGRFNLLQWDRVERDYYVMRIT